jgi:hypothetical protein
VQQSLPPNQAQIAEDLRSSGKDRFGNSLRGQIKGSFCGEESSFRAVRTLVALAWQAADSSMYPLKPDKVLVKYS